MPRSSKGPWEKKGRGWHVQHEGRRIFLGHDEGEAKKKWLRIQLGEPIDVPTEGTPLFWEVVESYCEEIERTRTPRHLRGTAWRLNQLCAHWRNRAVTSLRHSDIQKVMELHEWGPTTQANVLTSLRGMLRWASRPGGMIPTNPLPEITLPRAEVRVHVLSRKQIDSLLKASDDALRAILGALADTGARPSELIRAKAEECDVDGTAVRLAKGKQGRRIIFFPPSSRPAMKKLRKANLGGPLFRQPNGTGWSEYWFLTLARKARQKAKLPDWATAYCLRHAWITERLREGVPIATVARMAGTSVALIDSRYGHLSDQDLRKVADGLG